MKRMSLEDQTNILGHMLYKLIDAQRNRETDEHYKNGFPADAAYIKVRQ